MKRVNEALKSAGIHTNKRGSQVTAHIQTNKRSPKVTTRIQRSKWDLKGTKLFQRSPHIHLRILKKDKTRTESSLLDCFGALNG